MQSVVNDVRAFMERAGQELPAYPQIVSEKIVNLRQKLNDEEFDELCQGIADQDLVEIADGAADLIYVVVGACLAFGIDLVPIWDEVQRTNMQKFDGPKSPEGKQLKPEGWQPPAISDMIQHQINLGVKLQREAGGQLQNGI